MLIKGRYVFNRWGGILENFGQKSRGPPTFRIGFMHDPSKIPKLGLYNSDQLSSLRVDELSLYFSHHKIIFKGKKAEKVAMIKAHIGSLLCNSTGRQQPLHSPLRNVD